MDELKQVRQIEGMPALKLKWTSNDRHVNFTFYSSASYGINSIEQFRDFLSTDRLTTVNSNQPIDCVICMDSWVTVAIFPCLHLNMCYGCTRVAVHGRTLKTCPICRTSIRGYLLLTVDLHKQYDEERLLADSFNDDYRYIKVHEETTQRDQEGKDLMQEGNLSNEKRVSQFIVASLILLKEDREAEHEEYWSDEDMEP